MQFELLFCFNLSKTLILLKAHCCI